MCGRTKCLGACVVLYVHVGLWVSNVVTNQHTLVYGEANYLHCISFMPNSVKSNFQDMRSVFLCKNQTTHAPTIEYDTAATPEPAAAIM